MHKMIFDIKANNSSGILPIVLRGKELRRGKWLPEEEAFVNEAISLFHRGLLNLSPGVTLRQFLSTKLNCDPMRITKKYAGEDCIGKCSFNPAKFSTIENALEAELARGEVEKLEKIWHDKLFDHERECLRKSSIQGNFSENSHLTTNACREKLILALKDIQNGKDLHEILEWHQYCVDVLNSGSGDRHEIEELVDQGESLMMTLRDKFYEHYNPKSKGVDSERSDEHTDDADSSDSSIKGMSSCRKSPLKMDKSQCEKEVMGQGPQLLPDTLGTGKRNRALSRLSQDDERDVAGPDNVQHEQRSTTVAAKWAQQVAEGVVTSRGDGDDACPPGSGSRPTNPHTTGYSQPHAVPPGALPDVYFMYRYPRYIPSYDVGDYYRYAPPAPFFPPLPPAYSYHGCGPHAFYPQPPPGVLCPEWYSRCVPYGPPTWRYPPQPPTKRARHFAGDPAGKLEGCEGTGSKEECVASSEREDPINTDMSKDGNRDTGAQNVNDVLEAMLQLKN